MSRKAFEAIQAGLEDAIAQARGDKSRGRERRVSVSKIGRIDKDPKTVLEALGVRQPPKRVSSARRKTAKTSSAALRRVRRWS